MAPLIENENMKFLCEVVYQAKNTGKIDLKLACQALGLNHETWRKRYAAFMKEHESSRGNAAVPVPVPAAGTGTGTPKTPVKKAGARAKATPVKSTPVKRSAAAMKGSPSKRQKVEDDSGDDADESAVYVPTPGSERPKRSAGKVTKYQEEDDSDGKAVDSGSDLDDGEFKESPKTEEGMNTNGNAKEEIGAESFEL